MPWLQLMLNSIFLTFGCLFLTPKCHGFWAKLEFVIICDFYIFLEVNIYRELQDVKQDDLKVLYH